MTRQELIDRVRHLLRALGWEEWAERWSVPSQKEQA